MTVSKMILLCGALLLVTGAADVTYRTFVLNKLWRDKRIEMGVHNGSIFKIKPLDDQEFLQALRSKLMEEAQEVCEAQQQDEVLMEMADVLEVIHTLCDAYNITFDEVMQARQKKRETSGKFTKDTFVTVVKYPVGSFLEKYATQHYVGKYEEIIE